MRLTKAQKASARQEEEAKRQERLAEVRLAFIKGCPLCGATIKRNLSMTGWYQCSQLGAVGFRADAEKPSCSWQTFVS